jgi:hypothetical protein
MRRRIVGIFWFLTFLALASGCATFVSSFQSSFFSKFSLQELVQRNKSTGVCAAVASGGGGGGGIGTGSGGIGMKQSSFQRSESFSCQLRDPDQFDETKFIQALKQAVESDLEKSKAKIMREDFGPAGFYFEYSHVDINGRVEISGRLSPGNHYTLHADLHEKRGGSK